MNRIIEWFWPSVVQPRISKSSIENVCFKGGGMKGNAFAGVDRAFAELGLWPQIKRFIGSSAGAIFAGAAACRIPYKDMAAEIASTDFSKFEDSSWGVVGEGVRLVEYLGFYEGAYFYDWYGNLLEKYIGDKEITLQGVYDRFGSDLVITTTDLTKKKLVFLTRHNYPTLKLCDAVRRSMSIPVFYVPIKEVDDQGLTHLLVDGSCTDNFPLKYFDNLYPTAEEAFGKTIGFDLEDSDQTDEINNIIDLVATLINTTIEVIEQLRLSPDDKYRTVYIKTWNYSSTDFNMSSADIQKLVESGYKSTMEFFENLKE